ncbi:high mobility group box domain-containing protein [Pisolithus croceorrhizus]|nr:high mobility group box domain-containing protein [Pisolithus croceorrhizus]
MATKPSKEEAPDVESTRSQFITKLTGTADAMRKFSDFADTLARVVAKIPLDDPEIIETLQVVVDATPTISRKRKLSEVTEEVGKKRKREKKVKDPHAPKAPPSAYIMFQNDVRTRVRAEHPGLQYKELMGLISKQWNSLSPEKKQPYFDKVSDAKKNHEVDMAKYIADRPAVEEGSTSKKAKKEPVQEPVEKPAKKPAPVKVAKPDVKSAELAELSDSDVEVSSAVSDVEDEVANGRQSDDESADDSTDEEIDQAPKEPTPPPVKTVKKEKKGGRK